MDLGGKWKWFTCGVRGVGDIWVVINNGKDVIPLWSYGEFASSPNHPLSFVFPCLPVIHLCFDTCHTIHHLYMVILSIVSLTCWWRRLCTIYYVLIVYQTILSIKKWQWSKSNSSCPHDAYIWLDVACFNLSFAMVGIHSWHMVGKCSISDLHPWPLRSLLYWTFFLKK